MGWAVLPAEQVGEHHLRMRLPPVPASANDLRVPRTDDEMSEAYVHCELAHGLCGELAVYAHVRAQHEAVSKQEEKRKRLLARGSVAFQPSLTGFADMFADEALYYDEEFEDDESMSWAGDGEEESSLRQSELSVRESIREEYDDEMDAE